MIDILGRLIKLFDAIGFRTTVMKFWKPLAVGQIVHTVVFLSVAGLHLHEVNWKGEVGERVQNLVNILEWDVG